MILTAAIFFFIFLAGKLGVDYWRWKRGEAINHSHEAAITGLYLSAVSCLLAVPLYHRGVSFFFPFIYCWLLTGFTWWVLFDGLFNLIRREKWSFNEFDPTDAKLDLLQQKYKWLPIAKIIVSLGLKVGYIIMVL